MTDSNDEQVLAAINEIELLKQSIECPYVVEYVLVYVVSNYPGITDVICEKIT